MVHLGQFGVTCFHLTYKMHLSRDLVLPFPKQAQTSPGHVREFGASPELGPSPRCPDTLFGSNLASASCIDPRGSILSPG